MQYLKLKKYDIHDIHDIYGRSPVSSEYPTCPARRSTLLVGHGIHVASRRRALGALLAGASLLIIRPATATPDELTAALRETFGDRPIQRGKVKLEIPRLAENGSVVPVTVIVDSPMTQQAYVKSIHLFAEKNHLPRMLEVQLGPYNGKAVLTSRVRVATSQQLTAVAVLNDDSLWSAAADIEVVTSECGL